MDTHSLPARLPKSATRLQADERILSDDGTELVGDLYIPGGTPPFPAIMEITPYCAKAQAKLGEIYAARGFLFLAVDTRGRYRSGGQWEPMIHDRMDGHAVIRWLSEHALCNGRVGTRGHSYCGYNQLHACIDAPEALQAMVVCVAPGDPFDNVPFRGGAYDLYDLIWLMGMTGRGCPDDVGSEDFGINRFGSEQLETNPYREDNANGEEAVGKWAAIWRARADSALATRPFGELDVRLGVRHEVFREWIAHWRLDGYWRARSAIGRLDQSAVPTLHVSGWWDTNGRGATTAFRAMRGLAKTSKARECQRLLMGAWTHDLKAPDCSDLPTDEAAQIERAARRDELNDEFAWFDRHLKDITPSASTRARVTLFVTGTYRWIDFEDWPPPQTQPTEYYLSSRAGGDSAGLLREAFTADGAGESAYVFDPSDPTPFAGPHLAGECGPFDNSAVQRERSDLLLFDTPPVAEPLALIGEPALILYARADAADFDLCVKLQDRHPDGRAICLAEGVVRARFRAGWQQPAPVVPGTIERYCIDLWHIAHVLRPGHALRLEISSAAFGRYDVNPCTGGDLASETRQQKAHIVIAHTAAHRSHVRLPICRDNRLTAAPP